MNESPASILDNRRALYDHAKMNGTVGIDLARGWARLLMTAGAKLDRFEKGFQTLVPSLLGSIPSNWLMSCDTGLPSGESPKLFAAIITQDSPAQSCVVEQSKWMLAPSHF